MAQGNPSRKKRFSFFGKARSEAHQSSDLQPPSDQSRPGSFTSLRSKAKDLVTRRAEQPKPSQGDSPSTDATENSAQLTVPEGGANEPPNMSANHPSVSLQDPPDGNSNVSTSDQHAQTQPSKLPETGESMHEVQTVHGAELNDSATGVTNKPDSEEITAHCAEPNDSAAHADSKPDPEGVDAARLLARQEFSGLNPVFGPVQAVASGINDAGDPVAAVDYVTPLLGTVSKFNSIVDTIAEIHPYAKAAWGVLSVVPKTIISQTTRDESLRQLLSKMDEVYMFLTETDLENIKTMKPVVTKICQQTLECCYFIRDYSKSKNFWARLGRNVVSETDGTVKRYNTAFDDLMQQFRDRAVRDTVVVVHRMLEGIQELIEGVDLSGMKCAEGAGLDTRKKCLPGTREEILDEITTWINDIEDGAPRIFWLHGSAGTGKSAIAHTIADRFRGLGRLGSCYCFDRTRAAQLRHEKVFTTIARGLADRDEQMRHTLANVIHHDNSLTNTPDIMQQWKELIMKPASKLSDAMVGPTLIVIEALDESGDGGTRQHLLRILAGKSDDDETHIYKLPSNFRILVTSRPLPDIDNAFNGVKHVLNKSMDSIPFTATERDILHYVTSELSHVDDVHGDELLTSLARESGGLFEWARLACAYIKEDNEPGLTPSERFEAIISHKSDDHVPLLDQMYEFTLRSMFPQNQRQREKRLARFWSVMAQVLGTLEPLPLASLRSMKRYFPEDNSDVVTAIVKPMAALLSGTADPFSVVRPLHASFPEFLTDKKRSGEFFVDTSGVHNNLAFASLGVMEHDLRFNICQLPSSYLPNSAISDLDERVKQHISPELSYSCRFWTDHLRKAVFSLGLASAVRAFFNHERLLFWFEARSLLKMINTTAGSLSSVIEWVKPHPSECKDILDDAADAQRFIRIFGLPISFSTPHLYLSALPFSPKKSRIFTKFANAFPSVLRIVSGHNLSWPVIQQVMRASSLVMCAAFSPDGKRVVLGLYTGTIEVWDAETGERLWLPLVGHVMDVKSVAFSPDGKRIVSGSSDSTIRLWDAETGHLLRPPLQGHEDVVTSVAFSPNGKLIASGSYDKTIRLWDAETGEPLRPPLKQYPSYVTCVAFSPNGMRIVSGSTNGIRLWNMQTGKLLPLLPHQKESGWVNSVAFSPNGKHIVSGSEDNTLQLWDAETGEPLRPPFEGHTQVVTSVAFSPNSKHIVSGSEDCTIRLWDAETGKLLQPPFEGHEVDVTSVAFSPDGKRILSGSRDCTSRLWESTTGEPLQPLLVQHNFFLSAAFTPDSKHILSGSHDTICSWDAETGELLRPPLKGPKNHVAFVAFSPDGKRIVLGLNNHTILLLDFETGELLQPPLKGHTGYILSVAFSPDGKHIVSGSYDKTIRLWDAETGKPLRPPLEGHEKAVWSVAFSPNAQHIVTGSVDSTVRLWDAQTGKSLIPPLVGHKNAVLSVRFSPDGKHIVSGSGDKTIRLWDVETGKLLRPPLEGHEKGVTYVAFSPDGKHIVSGSSDNTIRLWDAKTGGPLQLLKGQPVKSVVFSPDGQRIMSLSSDNIQLWDINPHDPRAIRSHDLEHLIRFSLHLGHSLVDAAALLDEITAPTQATSALPVRIRDDKWAVIGPKDRLLFWVPPTYNPRWCPPGMGCMIPVPNPVLDLSHMAHGLSWESCYRTHAHV